MSRGVPKSGANADLVAGLTPLQRKQCGDPEPHDAHAFFPTRRKGWWCDGVPHPDWRSVVAQTRDDLQEALGFGERWGIAEITVESRVKLRARVRDLSRLLDD